MDEKEEGRLIPVRVENVNLEILMRIDNGKAAGAEYERQLQIIEQLRRTFGENTLLEELSQLIAGRIERISISGNARPNHGRQQPQGRNTTNASSPHEHSNTIPVPVSGGGNSTTIPTSAGGHSSAADEWEYYRSYAFQSPKLSGHTMQTVDAKYLHYMATSEPYNLTQQDGEAILRYLQLEANRPKAAIPQPIPFKDDGVLL